MNPPDPEQLVQQMKEVLESAADEATGPSKAKFEALSSAFNDVVDAGLAGQRPNLMQAGQLLFAFKGVANAAKTDPEAINVLNNMTEKLQGLTGGIMGSLQDLLGGGGFGGGLDDLFGGPGGGFGLPKEEPEEAPKPAKRKPRKPKGGDFDLKGPGQ